MTEMPIDRAAIIQHLSALAHTLYEALGGGDTEKILAAQKNLSEAAEKVWAQIESAPIANKDKAIARLLADAAIKELPQTIQDPAQYAYIQQQIRLLKNALVLLQ